MREERSAIDQRELGGGRRRITRAQRECASPRGIERDPIRAARRAIARRTLHHDVQRTPLSRPVGLQRRDRVGPLTEL